LARPVGGEPALAMVPGRCYIFGMLIGRLRMTRIIGPVLD